MITILSTLRTIQGNLLFWETTVCQSYYVWLFPFFCISTASFQHKRTTWFLKTCTLGSSACCCCLQLDTCDLLFQMLTQHVFTVLKSMLKYITLALKYPAKASVPIVVTSNSGQLSSERVIIVLFIQSQSCRLFSLYIWINILHRPNITCFVLIEYKRPYPLLRNIYIVLCMYTHTHTHTHTQTLHKKMLGKQHFRKTHSLHLT